MASCHHHCMTVQAAHPQRFLPIHTRSTYPGVCVVQPASPMHASLTKGRAHRAAGPAKQSWRLWRLRAIASRARAAAAAADGPDLARWRPGPRAVVLSRHLLLLRRRRRQRQRLPRGCRAVSRLWQAQQASWRQLATVGSSGCWRGRGVLGGAGDRAVCNEHCGVPF